MSPDFRSPDVGNLCICVFGYVPLLSDSSSALIKIIYDVFLQERSEEEEETTGMLVTVRRRILKRYTLLKVHESYGYLVA